MAGTRHRLIVGARQEQITAMSLSTGAIVMNPLTGENYAVNAPAGAYFFTYATAAGAYTLVPPVAGGADPAATGTQFPGNLGG